MNIFDKIKILNEKKRYRRFKKCTIPFPFYDKKRNTFEWVSFYQNDYSINTSLMDSLGEKANIGVIYHFRAKLYGSDYPEQEMTYRFTVSHCHHIDEVVGFLYNYPETFEIPKEFLNEYSQQELSYLKQIKNYLLLIGLKDWRQSTEGEALDKKWEEIKKKKHKNLKDKFFLLSYQKKWKKITEKENLKRYENTKALEYFAYFPLHFKNDKTANAIIKGKKDYLIYIQSLFSSTRLNKKYFIINNNYDYIGIVEIISEEIIKFKDLEENKINYKLAGYKNFKEYKNHLLKEFKEESKVFNEEFSEDSLIKYVKLKVIETL